MIPLKQIMMYKLLFAFILLSTSAFAQQMSGEVKPTVDGWHKIMLPAEIRGNAKPDLADLRLYNSNKKEVPYIISQNNKATPAGTFVEYTIVEQTAIPNKSTTLILANLKPQISELTLYIANANVIKIYRISGSNDRSQWFGLIDRNSLYNLRDPENTSVLKQLSLPLSSYKFIKIEFDDTKSLPLNILKAGYFQTNTITGGRLLEVFPALKTRQRQKKTLIEATFVTKQHVAQVEFVITNPTLFRRKVRIYTLEEQKRRRKTSIIENTVAQFEVSSDTTTSFQIPLLLSSRFFIEIHNGDNEALTIPKIKFYQHPVFLVADMKIAETYSIKSGNQKLPKPDYDLGYFLNKLPTDLPEAEVRSIKQQNIGKTSAKSTNFWQQSWFLWLCIAVAGAAIAYFSFSLLKDIGDKKEH